MINLAGKTRVQCRQRRNGICWVWFPSAVPTTASTTATTIVLLTCKHIVGERRRFLTCSKELFICMCIIIPLVGRGSQMLFAQQYFFLSLGRRTRAIAVMQEILILFALLCFVDEGNFLKQIRLLDKCNWSHENLCLEFDQGILCESCSCAAVFIACKFDRLFRLIIYSAFVRYQSDPNIRHVGSITNYSLSLLVLWEPIKSNGYRLLHIYSLPINIAITQLSGSWHRRICSARRYLPQG